MSLVSALRGNGPSGFGAGSTAEDVTRGLALAGRTILITGSATGIGLETARVLSLRGASVICTARSTDRAIGIARGIGGAAEGLACDLSDPTSIRACIAELVRRGTPLDAIICNAGIMAPPRLALVCGYESQFFVNHIGHFMLVSGLSQQLADHGRVVMLSSGAHVMAPRGGIDFDNLRAERGYRPFTCYARSKFANLLFAKELARRLAGTGKTANAVHPGLVPGTALFRDMTLANIGKALWTPVVTAIAGKTIAQGAATSCYVSAHPNVAAVSGQYLSDCNVARPRADAEDAALAARLWTLSEQIAAGL